MSTQPSLPNHVGIILDGNRRWAKANGMPAVEGHRRGAEVFKDVSLQYFDKGIVYLSAFVFSAENWQRTSEEVSYLMKLLIKAVEKYLDEFNKKGIKICIAGRRDGLPKAVLGSIVKTEEKTKDNTTGVLTLYFNYGGQQEIVDALKQIIDKKVPSKKVDEKLIEQNLYSPQSPPLDLLIRTSGEYRTSGFMLWQAAYAELLFVDEYWPDFSLRDVNNSLKEFANRQRRFGG